jgi:signal peptidase I
MRKVGYEFVFHWQDHGSQIFCGPAIGGAKSGINPIDPRKRRFATLVQSRFSIIKSYYGTGGDLNVDEIHEVIPD